MTHTMRRITAEVATKHRLPIRVIMGERRIAAYSLARDEAWAEIYATGKFSQVQIAKAFHRHCSSVCDGIQRHNWRVADSLTKARRVAA